MENNMLPLSQTAIMSKPD